MNSSYLEDSKGALVTHPDEAAHREFQHHIALERDEVPDVFQDEEARAIIIAVAQIGDDERVPKCGVLARIEAVHTAETLARWSTD